MEVQTVQFNKEVQIPQFNKDIDKNREFGLYPIADKDFVTIQLDQDSTLKDLRDKLSEELQINSESIILRGLGARIPATEEEDIYLFKSRWAPVRGLDCIVDEGNLYRGGTWWDGRPAPFSFEIKHDAALREHVELLKTKILNAEKRLAASKMNGDFDDTDVFRGVVKYLKGGKKKRRKKRKTKSRRKSKSRTKSRRKSKSKSRRKRIE